MRWVPSGFKFYVAAQSGLLKLAALELLSSRVELQELVLDGTRGQTESAATATAGSLLVQGKVGTVVSVVLFADSDTTDALKRCALIGGTIFILFGWCVFYLISLLYSVTNVLARRT